MSEIKAIEMVDNALVNLSPDERARVLGWAQLKYGTSLQQNSLAHAPVAPMTAPKPPKSKGSKKAKTLISMDKSLNFNPPNATSATVFAAEKAPSNVMQKCVVAAYYLRETLQIQKVTAQAVFSFFKHLGWPLPADLKNTLQQAGSAGWLDTADSEDIKITSSGENLVEHELPPKAKLK
jgi:hypothetical protein